MTDSTGERLGLPWLAGPLREALAQQRAHALLVQAAEGIGAFEFMLTLATAWLCEGQGERPCGQCPSCRLMPSRSHPDLRVLLSDAQRSALGWAGPAEDETADGAKARKKPSRQIRIDEVRAAIDWSVHSSSRGRAKVLLIHPAEAMNLQAASALLKTLEEPAGQTRLVLGCSDAEHLLPTVRSRCQRLRLAGPDAEQALAWLTANGVGENDGAVLLGAAAGRPLEALALSEIGIDARRWLALPGALVEGQAGVFAGLPVPRVLDLLQKICHDAMVLAVGGKPRYFSAAALPPGAQLAALLGWARSLSRVARHGEHPWNEGLLVEALVAEGRACWQDDTKRPPPGRRALATLNR
jgi:DNA polymerase-3 subunit delta'